MASLKKFFIVLVLALFSILSFAQTATVKHNVNLRNSPSTENPPIVLLKPPTLLGVLELTSTNGYYRVVTDQEEEGWVWGRNVKIDEDEQFDPTPDIPAYNRADWKHWIDADHDCQNTRNEVLIRDSQVAVQFTVRADGKYCTVAAGSWVDPYSGRVFTDPGKLDIDHLVPLQNAHLAGGWRWDNDKRQEYANFVNDNGHLLAVEASLNRQKGAKGPEEWTPPNQSYWCEYGKEWERVKSQWHLTMTTAEADAVRELKRHCQ